MRVLPAIVLLFAACGSSFDGDRSEPAAGRVPRVRVVYRQYLRGSHIFILENLAGRELKELRSRPIKAGATPVAYVPDEVMNQLLREFKRRNFNDYAVPRPGNPIKLGASGEITRIDEGRRMRSLLRIKLPAGAQPTKDYIRRSKAYVACANNFLAVWNHYAPEMQATTGGDGAFGVKRADYGR